MEPAVETTLGRPCVGEDFGRLTLASPAQVDPDRGTVPVAPRSLDEHATYVCVSGLGDGTPVHRGPARVLGGDEPGEGHERRSTGEATEVADLGGDAHRRERVDPAETAESGDGLSERRQLSGGLDLGGDGSELAPSHVESGEVVAIGGIGGGLAEAVGACP